VIYLLFPIHKFRRKKRLYSCDEMYPNKTSSRFFSNTCNKLYVKQYYNISIIKIYKIRHNDEILSAQSSNCKFLLRRYSRYSIMERRNMQNGQRTLENIIKKDVKYVHWRGWNRFQMTQDRDHWRVFVKTVMKWEWKRKFLASWGTSKETAPWSK
jgi:hypothetical protein